MALRRHACGVVLLLGEGISNGIKHTEPDGCLKIQNWSWDSTYKILAGHQWYLFHFEACKEPNDSSPHKGEIHVGRARHFWKITLSFICNTSGSHDYQLDTSITVTPSGWDILWSIMAFNSETGLIDQLTWIKLKYFLSRHSLLVQISNIQDDSRGLIGLTPFRLPPIGLPPFGLPLFGLTPFRLTPIGLGLPPF